MSDEGAAAAAVQIHILRAKADDLRGQITDAISALYSALQPCEESEPAVIEIIQQTRDRMRDADAGFFAVQFVLGSRMVKWRQELEETQRLLEKRAIQREGRLERIDYLEEHLDTRRQALSGQVSKDRREKLTTESNEISRDLQENQQVVELIDKDVEERKQDEEELKPTIDLLGEIAGAVPSTD
jgi:hypothetical protein